MSDTTERVLLTVAVVALFAVVALAMRWAWGRRARRDDGLLPLPAPAADGTTTPVSVSPGVAGLYVGTVHAGRWTDRVSAGGLSRRASGTLRLTDEGVLVLRDRDEPVLVPRGELTDAYISPGLAGKVVGKRGLLVLGWRHNGVDLESGFRADDPVAQDRVALELGAWVGSTGGAA